MEANRRSRKARSIARGLVVVIVGFALAAIAAAPAPVRADPAVSHIALMGFGSFNAPGLPSWAAQVSCTSFDACVGVVGLPFPGFVLLEKITGSFACTPAGNPTQCVVSVASADIACDLTTSASPVPGLSNPVRIDCSKPQGSGSGVTTLNLLL